MPAKKLLFVHHHFSTSSTKDKSVLLFAIIYIILTEVRWIFMTFIQKGDSMQNTNYLLILCDQLSATALSAYGNTYSQTPNLDRLAAQSAVFDYTYTPCPLCQPARASFWTSRYPHETNVRTNLPVQEFPIYKQNESIKPGTFARISDEIKGMGEYFSDAGYKCIHFGKDHSYGALKGFDVVPDVQINIPRTNPSINFDYETYLDVDTTAKTVSWLTDQAPALDQPFLAVADIQNPHNICGYIGEMRDGCHPENFELDRELPPLPENFDFDDLENRPEFIQYLCCAHRRLRHAAHWTPLDYQYYLYAYYYYLAMADKQIGQILDALDKSGKRENTVILFFADHGEGMAGHHMVTKYGVFYEESNHVPFMFSGPGIKKGRIGGVSSLLDILPTMLDYSGIPYEGLAGTSQYNAITSNTSVSASPYVAAEWQDEFRGYTVPGRMICDENYKYICYGEPDSEELFDLKKDRLEKINVAKDPSYASVLDQYREKLEAHLTLTHDDFHQLAVSDHSAYRHHKLGYCNHEGLSAVEVYAQSIKKG